MSTDDTTKGLRENIDLAVEDGNLQGLAEALKMACDVIDGNLYAHQNVGSATAEEFGNAYGRHELAGELADALDEALDT